MRTNPRRLFLCALQLGALLAATMGNRAAAAEFDVPGAYATIQAAIDAAELSEAVINNVNLTAPLNTINQAIDVGPAFGPARKLTIRPKPGLKRATIASKNGFDYILVVHNAGNVVVQDLDLIRNVTNRQHLVYVAESADVVVERCRIGSNWSSVGPEGYSNLVIDAPENLIVRNCLFFSYLFGNFDNAVLASLGSGLNNSLFLYNNTAADYRYYGYSIAAHNGDQFVLLRNNVAINRNGVVSEPNGYHSACSNVTVVTSHNTAFAGAANVEVIEAGCDSIAGDLASNFVRLARISAAASFVQTRWDINPQFDPNPDFCRLVAGGPLHDAPADSGRNVENGAPHARDTAVTNDWEKTARPNGLPLHTDRGADQIRDGDFLIGLSLVSVTPSTLIGGGPAGNGLVKLTDFVPGPDATVFLSTTNPAATVPATVVVPNGKDSATFLVKTTAVTKLQSGSLQAKIAASSLKTTVRVRPVHVSKLSLNPTKVVGGASSTATVTLEIPAPIDTVVSLSSSYPAVASLPASITIPKGALTGTAIVTTTKVPSLIYVTITATADGASRTAKLTVTP